MIDIALLLDELEAQRAKRTQEAQQLIELEKQVAYLTDKVASVAAHADAVADRTFEIAQSRAEEARAMEQQAQAQTWQPIESGPKGTGYELVALIRDGKIWRVSVASFNGIGWYDAGGRGCHWATHRMPLPALPRPAQEGQ